MTQRKIDVSSLSGWGGLPAGIYAITIKSKADGYAESVASNSVNITKVVYTLTPTVTNVTIDPLTATVASGGSQTFTLTADGTSYKLPTSINVAETTVNAGTSTTITNKCTVLFTRSSDTSGSITFSNVTDDVAFNIVGEQIAQPYVTFESDDGSEFTISAENSESVYSSHWNGTMEYSTNTTTWQTWQPDATISSVNGKLYIRGINNTIITRYEDPSCFLYGTQITLADGTTKNVEDLTYNDRLKVWDFENGCYSTAPICWLTKEGLTNNHYYQLTFSDGTILKTTGKNSNHKVYNVDEKFFKGVDKTQVGDRIFSENGIVTVIDKQYIEETVPYVNLITSRTIDCFANGILASDRYGNLYSIDDDMKWIKEDRPIRPLGEFTEAGISEYWYYPLRLSEQIDNIDKIQSYIKKCESQMRIKEVE